MVERGDVVTLVGPAAQVSRVAPLVGHALPPPSSTDLLSMTIAIALGGLGGLATFRLAGLDVGLSMPVGVLLGGLVAGLAALGAPRGGRDARAGAPGVRLDRADRLPGGGRHQRRPRIHHGLATSGVPLVVAGVLVCLVPNVVTILVGRYLLRIHPGVLMGICAGAGTSPAGLAAVQDKAGSKIPTLGYGVSYAVGNLLLALWGSVMVIVLSG